MYKLIVNLIKSHHQKESVKELLNKHNENLKLYLFYNYNNEYNFLYVFYFNFTSYSNYFFCNKSYIKICKDINFFILA